MIHNQEYDTTTEQVSINRIIIPDSPLPYSVEEFQTVKDVVEAFLPWLINLIIPYTKLICIVVYFKFYVFLLFIKNYVLQVTFKKTSNASSSLRTGNVDAKGKSKQPHWTLT